MVCLVATAGGDALFDTVTRVSVASDGAQGTGGDITILFDYSSYFLLTKLNICPIILNISIKDILGDDLSIAITVDIFSFYFF